MMNSFSSASDQASFLHPRDPSIMGWDQRVHYVAPVRKQLFSQVLEEESSESEPSKLKTYLRLKPLKDVPEDQATFSLLSDKTVVLKPPRDSMTFRNNSVGRAVYQYSFSKVLGPETSQKVVFNECVGHQVKDFILGSNHLLFAYGTTNAGKTYTIQGNESNPGLIPRSIDLIFRSIHGQVAGVGRYKPDKVEGIVELDRATMAQELDYKNRLLQWNWDKPLEPIKAGSNHSSRSNRSSETDFISSPFREMQKTLSNDSCLDFTSESDVVYGIWVSFAEVYNESVFDLLDPIAVKGRKRIPLRIAQDAEGNVFIRDLRMIHVASGDEAYHVMQYGKANLQIATTNMNSRSSRSHCIFTIKLVRYANSDNPSYAIVSSFTFCDLAGAERVKKTLNAGDRLKESNNINTSLHVLGRCLATIRENQKKHENKPVPFRDSKLTRIFQRAFTGHESISMIVNANMAPVLFDETVNVLKFSAIAKHIVVETPIKKSKPVAKKSRFSIMVSRPNHNGTICWDAPVEENSSQNVKCPVDSGEMFANYNAKNEELLMLVERLKDQLREERQKNLTLERDIRQTVGDTFSKIITDMEKTWKSRMKDMEERNEQLSSWRIAQLENYYEKELENTRKRRRQSDLDDSVVFCETSDDKVKELQEEVKLLDDKYTSVRELMKEAQDIQATLTAENLSLKSDLSHVTTELENCRQQLSAAEEQVKGSSGSLVQELQIQLAEEKKNAAEAMKRNEHYRELLDEAKLDFDVLTKDLSELQTENEKLHHDILLKTDELAEIQIQLDESNSQIALTTRTLDQVEEKYDCLLKIQDIYEKTVKDIANIILEPEEELESLKELLQSLSVSDVNPPEIDSDNVSSTLALLSQSLPDALRTKLREHQRKLQEYEAEIESVKEKSVAGHVSEKLLQEKGLAIQKLADEKSVLEAEILQLKGSVTDLVQEKDESQSRVNQMEDDIKLLQKDLKGMLQKNMKLEQEVTESRKELEENQNTIMRLELELKSALQKSSSQLNSSVSSQSEHEALLAKLKAYDETMPFLTVWKDESIKLKEQLQEAREENQRLKDELLMKENEMSNFNANRSQLISRYEEALKKSQEEVEREKREAISLRDTLYRSTPTPKKNESAEIRQLKEQVECLQAELHSRNSGVTSSKKGMKISKKAPRHVSTSSNDSVKENIVDMPLSSSKSKKATSTEVKEEMPTSSSKKQLMMEPPVPPAVNEEATKRKGGRKKLFSNTQSRSLQEDGDETIEAEYLTVTTPTSYLKRSLRSRKV